MRPFAFLPAAYDTGITQDFHVVGQPGLRKIHWLLQDAGAFLAAAQLLQNGKPLGVTQRLKYFGVFLMCSNVFTSHQNILIY